MACRGPDHLYTKQQLQEIIKCSSKVAEELLAETKNDLNDAVEKYFAREGGKEPESVKDGGVENLSDVKLPKEQWNDNSTGGSIITSRPRLRKIIEDLNKKLILVDDMEVEEDIMQDVTAISLAEVEDLNKNLILVDDMEAEEDMMQEVTAISLAEHYPHIDVDTIKYMVKKFQWRQDELFKYLEREAPNEQYNRESFDEGYSVIKMRSDSLEFDFVRDEFLRMTTDQINLKVCSIDLIRNKKSENNFDRERVMMKSRGFSDLSSLLFPVKCPQNMEDVFENNFKMMIVSDEMGFDSTTIGVAFTETPKVPMVDMLPEEHSHLMMCLVLAGDSAMDREGNVTVTSVNKILPKYVVHYCVERRE